MSSVVGEKEKNRVIPSNGRIKPPELIRASLSLTVSQRTEQNLVFKVFLLYFTK